MAYAMRQAQGMCSDNDGIFARNCTWGVSGHKGCSPPASRQEMAGPEGFVKLAQRWKKSCQGQKDG